nr:hypothetical protein HK105_002270 [Polyrhizophydium stewartii]
MDFGTSLTAAAAARASGRETAAASGTRGSSSALTGGLIPVPAGGAAGAASKPGKLDLDLDDDDFDDILALSSDSDDGKAGSGRSGKHKKGSTKSNSSSKGASTTEAMPLGRLHRGLARHPAQKADSSDIPTSRYAMPRAAASPLGSAGSTRPSPSMPMPMPAPAKQAAQNAAKAGADGDDKADVDNLLKSLQDMDDLDSQLFGKPHSAPAGGRRADSAAASSPAHKASPSLQSGSSSSALSFGSADAASNAKSSASSASPAPSFPWDSAGAAKPATAAGSASPAAQRPSFLSGGSAASSAGAAAAAQVQKPKADDGLFGSNDGSSLLSSAAERGRGRRQTQAKEKPKVTASFRDPKPNCVADLVFRQEVDDVADDDMFDLLGLGDGKQKKQENRPVATGSASGAMPSFLAPRERDGAGAKPSTTAASSPTKGDVSLPPFLSIGASENPSPTKPGLGFLSSQALGASVGSGFGAADASGGFGGIVGSGTAEQKPAAATATTGHVKQKTAGSGSGGEDDGIPSFLLESGTSGRRRRGQGSLTGAAAPAARPSNPDPMDLIAGLMGGMSTLGGPPKPAAQPEAKQAVAAPAFNLPCK